MKREQRDQENRALVAAAPAYPEQMPAPTKGKMKLTDVIFPTVHKLYNQDESFRKLTGSLTVTDSPSGRLCFDDAFSAQKVKDAITEDGDNPMVNGATLGHISTAVKFCLRRVGLARTQRIASAKHNLLSAASSPAE